MGTSEETLMLERSAEEDQGSKPGLIKALNNVNIQIPAQSMTMVVGDIGSGKSSLLYALLGEMTPDLESHPEIHIHGSVAFCSQKPWIMSGTVKANILFFLPLDEEKL